MNGTYYGDPSQPDTNTPVLPVLRMAQTPPVAVSAPRVQSKSGGGGGGGLNTAALGKKIAGLLNQKYGGQGGLSPQDQASLQGIDLSQAPDDYNFVLPDGSNALSAVDAATIPQGVNFSQLPDNFNFQV